MKTEWDPRRLDIKSFVSAASDLKGSSGAEHWERIAEQAHLSSSQVDIRWAVRGELKSPVGRPEQVWLYLSVQASVPQTCQRCLEAVESSLAFDRAFRFVVDEETAAAQDADSEEDILVLSRTFDLLELIEDEVLMELPLVPRHEQCPVSVKLSVADEGFEEALEAARRPFDALAALRRDGSQ